MKIKFLFFLIILFLLNFLFTHWVNSYYTQIVCMLGINIIMAVSLNLINGQTGQFSLGHAGFMAIGAYTSAAITFYARAHLLSIFFFLPPSFVETLLFIAALFLGGTAALLAGLLIGIPTLRLRGDYLAIATLGFSEIIRVLVLNLDFVGGARGFSDIPEYSNFFWIFLFAVLSIVVVNNLVRSIKGLSFGAIREDEIAAESVGIPAARYKVIAFGTGAFLAGIGGGLFAHLMAYLHTNSFSFLKSIEFVVMIVLGGLFSITGAIVGAILLTVLPEFLRVVSDWRMILYSLLLIVMMLGLPQGLLGRREWGWLKKKE